MRWRAMRPWARLRMCCGRCLGSIGNLSQFSGSYWLQLFAKMEVLSKHFSFVGVFGYSSGRLCDRNDSLRARESIQMRLIHFLTSATFLLGTIAGAQQQPSGIAPIPAVLYNAKKVFISNAGADAGLFPHPFSGDPDRAYNAFYAGVESLGKFNLVASPSEADLVFELQLMAPSGPCNADKSTG